MAASSTTDSLPYSTLIHMLTIRLTSTNYLLWRSQVLPLLIGQGLVSYIDGTQSAPQPEISVNNASTPNSAYLSWRVADQRLVSLLFSFLTEESMAVIVGCTTAREVWLALEHSFSHQSKAREFRLRGQLQTLRKGDKSVADFGREFKLICDQLSAIGVSIDESDKIHLFMKGLGSAFSNFSTTQMALSPSFSDLLNNAEAWDLFQQTLDQPPVTQAAFLAHPTSTPGSQQQSGGRSSQQHSGGRGSQQHSGGRGSPHGSQSQGGRTSWQRRPPTCQICRTTGHYANVCPDRFKPTTSPASPSPASSANIAEAFSAACNINDRPASDWYLDTGASAHMTPSAQNLDVSLPYTESGNSGSSSSRQT